MTADTIEWIEIHSGVIGTLRTAGIVNADNEARWILEEASGLDWSEISRRTEPPLATEKRLAHLDGMVERRVAGEPLQYVLGHWTFRRLDLMVDRRVLIPRPETEEVVSVAIAALDTAERAHHTVVDLGTGSGAIALSIAFERTDVTVWATDVSEGAISVARANAAGLGRAATRVTICHGSWFDGLPGSLRGSVDLIVTNPPYVPEGDALPKVIAEWEPPGALYSGADGLEDIGEIIAMSTAWLAPGGTLIVEMGPDQVPASIDTMVECGFSDVASFVDLSGRNRGVRGNWR